MCGQGLRSTVSVGALYQEEVDVVVVLGALLEVHDEGGVHVVQCVDVVQLLVRAVRQLRLAMETLEQEVTWRMKKSQMTRMHTLVRISDLIFSNH